jgi:hypothetical protein
VRALVLMLLLAGCNPVLWSERGDVERYMAGQRAIEADELREPPCDPATRLPKCPP